MTRGVRWIAWPFVILASLVLNAWALWAEAPSGVWNSLGPSGGYVTSLVVAPGASGGLYAGTFGGGVFESTDGGTTWTAKNTGLADLYVLALACDPKHPTTLYCGTYSQCAFKSVDGGTTWMNVRQGLGANSVKCLLVSPASSKTVFAGGNNGLYRSTDGGLSWQSLRALNTTSLAVNPASPKEIYAATINGLIVTTDGGNSWNDAPLDASTNVVLGGTATAPGTVIVGCFQGGIAVSTDGAQTWTTAAGPIATANVVSLARDPSTPNTLYAGASHNGGVFKSSDGGTTWAPLPGALTNPNVFALTVVSGQGRTLLAGTGPYDDSLSVGGVIGGAGVFASQDDGASWQPANAGLIATSLSGVAVNPSRPSELYAATLGGGLFKSEDGGTSWSAEGAGKFNYNVTSVLLDPSNPNQLFAATAPNAFFDSISPGGIYGSPDGGSTWQTIDAWTPAPDVLSLAAAPTQPTTLYAGQYWTGGLYRSTDGGQTWAQTALDTLGVERVVTVPTASGSVYVISGGNLFDSTDAGATWNEIYRNAVTTVAVAPSNPQRLYVGGFYQGIAISSDGGQSWTQALYGQTIEAIAVDPEDPDKAYAGVVGQGMFETSDGGTTWEPFGAGLENTSIEAAQLDAQNGILYAGTGGGGLYGINLHPSPSASPVVSKIKGGGSPFRLTLQGSDFHADVRVYLGYVSPAWRAMTVTGDSKLVLTGGKALQAQFPSGQPVTVLVVNADGGSTAVSYTR